MDLGISGRKAIVCASSKGLGKGCAMALAREGVAVVINGRNADTVTATAAETERIRQLAESESRQSGQSVDEILDRDRANEVARRFGTPEEFGSVCAFLCSVHTGFITGENLVLDGGDYPGTL